MSTIGTDCQVILDGHGYFVEPRAYTMKRPRIRKAMTVKGGQERYTDLGPGKRTWHLVLLCLNQLTDYTGQRLSTTGQQLRDQLVTSYAKLDTLSYVDLDGATYTVHFDDYEEQVRDPRTQLTPGARMDQPSLSPSYHVSVVLVEA